MSGREIKLTGEVMGDMLSVYLNQKPAKDEICPLIMILMDYYTDDEAEKHMTVKEFLNDAMRKRSMLQDLIEKWRKK